MIKNIIIKPRREIKFSIAYKISLSKKPWALISIWSELELITSFEKELLEKMGCNETLSIRFSDITDKEHKQTKKGILFKEDQAKSIVSFIDKINLLNITELYIHCTAGISRSGAIGTWACRYLNLDETEFRKNNRHILPNIYILCTLNKFCHINDDYLDFWKNSENEIKRKKIFNFNCRKNVPIQSEDN